MVAKAKEAWGGVHILINNAGILRDKSFAKMEPADFEFVVEGPPASAPPTPPRRCGRRCASRPMAAS